VHCGDAIRLREFKAEFRNRGGMGQAKEMSHRDRQYGLPLKVKRTVDLIVSFAFLTAFSPVLFAIGILLFVTMGGPILFRQQRPGRYGRPFTLLKFRTMREARDAEGRLLADEARLTALGKVLRELSLDELPQLWNVLRGDMSLVGPRPLLMQYLERYSAEEMRRHEVKPGITGWAQVNGRASLPWHERIELDVWYVEHRSPRLDLRILARTPRALFGATYKGETGGWTPES